MPTNDRGNEPDELIERLKARAATAADGRMVAYESDGLTLDVQEQFWRNVVAFETAGSTDLSKELNAIGVKLLQPDDLDDVAQREALWSIIEGLARLRVFLDQTDHLSDRELYTQLLRELLPEDMPALDVDESSAWHIDVLGYDKPELYLRYYADEKTRESWRIDFPDDPIPAREDPPYDRDPPPAAGPLPLRSPALISQGRKSSSAGAISSRFGDKNGDNLAKRRAARPARRG